MKRFAMFACILAAAAMAAWADTASLTLEDAPEEIELAVYPKRTVSFPHKDHAKRIGKCQVCHHMPDTEKCSECHEAAGGQDTPSFSEAMHVRCRSCHKKSKEGVTGKCSECHPNVKSGT